MNTASLLPKIHLVRHGETEWSLTGRHTSHTEIPLTVRGEAQARQLGERLRPVKFARIFTSPRARARQTYELAGLSPSAEVETDLREWDYGEYEGRTSAEIHATHPRWNLFADGAPGGESPAEVFARAENFARRLRHLEGNVAIFSHGHFLRVLAAAWVGYPVASAQRLDLDTASVGILGYEHGRAESPVISLWNESCAETDA